MVSKPYTETRGDNYYCPRLRLLLRGMILFHNYSRVDNYLIAVPTVIFIWLFISVVHDVEVLHEKITKYCFII